MQLLYGKPCFTAEAGDSEARPGAGVVSKVALKPGMGSGGGVVVGMLALHAEMRGEGLGGVVVF